MESTPTWIQASLGNPRRAALAALLLATSCTCGDGPAKISSAPSEPTSATPAQRGSHGPRFGAVARANGAELPLLPDRPTEAVPTEASFSLEVDRRIEGLQLRLYDENYRLVPSSDSLLLDISSTTYRLTPSEPLAGERRFTLAVEGLSSGDERSQAEAPRYRFRTAPRK